MEQNPSAGVNLSELIGYMSLASISKTPRRRTASPSANQISEKDRRAIGGCQHLGVNFLSEIQLAVLGIRPERLLFRLIPDDIPSQSRYERTDLNVNV
jgi:hypothetical protein